jgi:hypothetical protein
MFPIEYRPEDYEVRMFYSIGKVKKNVAPFPLVLSTQIFPPIISISDFEMANPSPVPVTDDGFDPST